MSDSPRTEGISYCSLASSSRFGNAYLVASGSTHILVDYGVPLRRLESHLDAVGCDPSDISAIFVTHEHGDHCRALGIRKPFHSRHGIPIYATPSTWGALGFRDLDELHRPLQIGVELNIGDFNVRAMSKLHDAREPVALGIRGNGDSLAVITDLGAPTRFLADDMRAMNHYIVESNHDEEMELRSPRPRRLIERVMGSRGHLSNVQAAQLMRYMCGPDTRSILLAHLSLDCNVPGLAAETMADGVSDTGFDGDIVVAPADGPSPWMGGNMRRQSRTHPNARNYRLGI